jgi:hypothetical protein
MTNNSMVTVASTETTGTYDQASLQNLRKHYLGLRDKASYDAFLRAAHELVTTLGIDPYYIRMALTGKHSMLEFGSRAAFQHREVADGIEVGLLIDREDVDGIRELISGKPHHFSPDPVDFVKLVVPAWKDIPPHVLALNEKAMTAEYKRQYGKKLVEQRRGSGTDNVAMQYAVISGVPLDQLPQARQTNNSMDYFTSADIDLLTRYAGVAYDKDSQEHQDAYRQLASIYRKVEHWAQLVRQTALPQGEVSILKKPTSQANRFEQYQWAKIYPSPTAPRQLAFTVSIEGGDDFAIKIDTVSLRDGEERREKYLAYRGPYRSSPIVKLLDKAQVLDLGWEGLVNESAVFIRSIQKDYSSLLNKLGLSSAQASTGADPALFLNTILYGPPGTGKTHTLKNEYFERFTTKPSEVPREQRLYDALQDLTWWEVIGTVLLDLGPSNVDDIMAHELTKAKAAMSNSKNVRATMWSNLQFHTVNECALVKYEKRTEPLIFNKREGSVWEVLDQAVDESYPELREQLERYRADYEEAGEEQKEVRRYEFVTFHQAYTYEDFIEGLKPQLDSKEIGYEIVPGIFKRLCERAEKDPEHQYALFIDEINRGNIAAIFGELITLIEDDKRLGAKNELRATLPYSKPATFGVPSNVQIIGTMNTADRSVEALDTALRRRFSFVECPSKPALLKDKVVKDENGVEVPLEKLLTVINARIEMLLDRDHHIGHSYFLNWGDADRENKLRQVFKNNIIPLLQEYFYGDPVKIGLVLGDGFVKELKNKEEGKVEFAAAYRKAIDIDPKPRYIFQDVMDPEVVPLSAFKAICDGN